MSRAKQFEQLVEREEGLNKSLTTGQISMIAIGGAIGTGLFLGSGFAIQMAGPSVLVSYAIGALIAFLIMGTLAEMTVAHPTSGSFGAFAEFYISPWAGFVVRYMYWSCLVAAVGTEVTAVAEYMHFWFPDAPGWFWILLFSAILIAVNFTSVKLFGHVEYWFSMIKIVAIVAFILLGAYVVFGAPAGGAVGFHNYVDNGGFFPHGISGMWTAVVLAIFSYLSVEMIAVTAGEAKDPQVAVPKAFRATVFRLVVFYLLTIAIMLAIVPWKQAGGDESPFVKVFQFVDIPAAAGVMNFIVLVAALSAMNSQLYITTRMMFSLSRGGFAPKFMGTLTKRGVPIYALIISSTGIAIAVFLKIAYPEQAFLTMMSIAMFGALFTWFMIFITHLFFRRRYDGPKPSIKMPGYPWLTAIGAILVASVLLTTMFVDEFKMTLIVGIPWLVIVSGSYWYFKKRQQQKQ